MRCVTLPNDASLFRLNAYLSVYLGYRIAGLILKPILLLDLLVGSECLWVIIRFINLKLSAQKFKEAIATNRVVTEIRVDDDDL